VFCFFFAFSCWRGWAEVAQLNVCISKAHKIRNMQIIWATEST
jgi:hypothetical protein